MGRYNLRNRDRLSGLPEELIINILSRLSLQESGRTCVLSRRWEKLWLLTNHCFGPNLIFKTPIYKELLSNPEPESRLLYRKRVLYAGLLDKVFKFHEQPLLDALVINVSLTSNFSAYIDNWIKFALSKGVRRLELDLSICPCPWNMPYVFRFPLNVHNERMRAVCLKGVIVDQQVVDALLSTFPLLDSLSLRPPQPIDLIISSAKLKHLELLSPYSTSAKRIEISAPSLVSFGYQGRTTGLHFRCIPRLSQFYVWDTDPSCPFFMRNDLLLVSSIPQLKKLKLKLCASMYICFFKYPLAFHQLVKLEEYEVEISGSEFDSLLWPTVLIKAFPFLLRFAITMNSYPRIYPDARHSQVYKRRIKKATKFRHRSLKVVEMSGFSGLSCDIELAQCLFEIGANSLEKVVINTRATSITMPHEDIIQIAQGVSQGLDPRIDFVLL